MLPFQLREAFRYGPSAMLARLILLRQLQERSFRTADGVIFLSQFARDCVGRATGPIRGQTAVIPHGVDGRFFKRPRPQSEIGTYSPDRPLRLLYTSIVDVYKHQWRVADAVARLRDEGLPVAVEFVGNSYPKAERRLQAAMRRHDPEGRFIKFAGPVEHAALHERYHSADAFVFASSCENLPNILLEAMAAGLPIACSCRGPMREILGSGGLYFDPLSAHDMTAALRRLVTGAALRRRLAAESYARATHYSWAECARETFDFLARVLQNHPSRCRQRVANPR